MLILASQSPRRKELMHKITDDFLIVPSEIDEAQFLNLPYMEAVKQIAYAKGEKIKHLYPNDVIISADTIVVLNEQIIGKPKDEEDAFNILKRLSGKGHIVVTNYAIFYEDKCHQNSVVSAVYFNKLSDDLIREYIFEKKPLDKAGAYGIQDEGYQLVKEVIGSLNNVIGFPIEEIRDDLMDLSLI